MKLSKAQIATLEKIKNRRVDQYFHRYSATRKFRGAKAATINSLVKMELVRIPFFGYTTDVVLELTDAGRAALEEVRK